MYYTLFAAEHSMFRNTDNFGHSCCMEIDRAKEERKTQLAKKMKSRSTWTVQVRK